MIVHGKKSLKNLLKSGKPLEVFTIKDKNLKKFCHDAKRRGVKYCVIRDKDRDDHTVDILADIDNLKMCNYIIERNKLGIEVGEVLDKGEIINDKEEKEGTKEPQKITNEIDNENKEIKDNASEHFLEDVNPFTNAEEFEIKEKMPLKEALEKLKILWNKTRQKIMSDKVISNDGKDKNIERE